MSRIQGKAPIENEDATVVGIDVSKATLDVFIHPAGTKFSVCNDQRGLAGLTRRLAQVSPSIVVMEATGRYHRAAWLALHGAGIKVAVINPYRSRRFADVIGRLAKTDTIGMLALGEATGAEFNLIPFGGGNPTAMAAITGEVDASALPLANPITFGEEARVLGIFADENPVPDQTNDAPTVNEVAGTDLPPLTSSRAWAVQADAIAENPELIEILKQTMRQTLEDPEYIEAVRASGVPAEFIDPGNQEEAMQEAAETRELAIQYRDLLTGE